MAGQPITLDFETSGSLLEDIRALADAARGLGEVHAKAQAGIQADLTKSSEKAIGFSKSLDVAGDTVIAIGREASRGGAANLGKSLESAAGSAAKLGTGMEKAGKAAVTAGQQGARGARQLGRAVQQSQAEAQASVKLTADQYVIIQQEIREAGIESEELTQAIAGAVEELAAAGVTADELAPSLEPAVGSVESLQRELRKAKLEAGKLAAEFGLDSEQALAAQRRVAELTDEVGDLNARFDAFNPDKKFEALNQVAFSLQGGLFAVQSLVQSIAGENEGLQRTITGVQTLLFASQGLQTLIGGMGDALKTLRATLLGTAAAQEAQAAAAGQSAVATAASGTAAAGASGGFRILTTSVRAFTVSLLTNPIFLAVAAITALGFAIYSAGQEAETAAEKTQKWIDGFDKARAAKKRLDGLLGGIRDAKRESEDIDIGESLGGRAAAMAQRTREDVQRLNAEVDAIFVAQSSLIKQAASIGIQAERSFNEATQEGELRIKNLKSLSDDQAEALELILQKYNELSEESDAIGREAFLRELQAANEQKKLQKDIAKAAADSARERKDIARSLAQELLDAERDLSTRLLAATADAGGSRATIELERENNIAEINELEKGFERKLALIELQKRLSNAAWQALGEAEREARADALLASGEVALPAQQQEQINALRLLAEEKYLRDLDALYTEQAKARLDLISDAREREREELELDLEQRAEALRKAGATEQQIREFQQREREQFTQEGALAAIALDQQIAEARINSQRRNGEKEVDFERRKQLELLAVKEAAAVASLAAIEEDGTKETALLRAQFEAVIAETEQARQRLLDNVPEKTLLDLLGVDPKYHALVKQSLNDLLQSAIQIAKAANEARQSEVREQIAATDAIVSDAQRRRSELQSELDRALQDQRDGYANNADALRDQIRETQRVEKAAMEDKKRQIQEQRRLARQAILIDAAAQVSALALSVANLIKTWSSLPYGVGLVAAFAQAAGIVAFVASTSAKLKAASRDGPTFRKGGVLKDSTLFGPSHEAGGIALLDRRTGHYYGEAEGGEGIVSRKAMTERGPMVHAINIGDMGRLQELARAELLRAGHMVIRPGDVRRMQGLSAAVAAPRGDDTAPRLLAEVAALREEVAGFRRQEAERERVDGNRVRLPQHTITRR